MINLLFSLCSWCCFITDKYAHKLPVPKSLCGLVGNTSSYNHMKLLDGEFKASAKWYNALLQMSKKNVSFYGTFSMIRNKVL